MEFHTEQESSSSDEGGLPEQLSDEDLVRCLLRGGNPTLREELYRRYAPFVYKRSLAIMRDEDLAKDMTHDVMLKVFLSLAKFSFRSSFSYWVYRITYNHCVNVLKQQRKWKISATEDLELYDESEDLLLAKIDKEEKLLLLERAIDRLSESERMLLWMHYRDEIALKDMAKVLNIGLSAVKMRLKRVRDKLASIYQNLEHERR